MRTALLLCLLTFTARAEGPAIPASLSLDQAVALFEQHGFDLLIADAAVASAKGDTAIASAVPNPTASIGGGPSWNCGGPSCPALFNASLSDNAAIAQWLSGKRGLRQVVAASALAAARASRDDAHRTLTAQVKAQFAQLLLAQENLRVAREAKDASAQLVELTRIRYRSGAISEADVARVETDELEAEQTVDQAQGQLEQDRNTLAFLLGVRGETPPFVAHDDSLLHAQPPSWLTDEATLLERAWNDRPDLKAQRSQVDRADAALSLARRDRLPDIALTAGYSQQGTGVNASSPPTFSVSLSAPLPLWYHQAGEIAKAEADARTQTLLAEKAQAQVATDVQQALAGYRSANALVTRMDQGLLARARRARDLVQVQYEKGAASLLELLDAQRTYRAITLEYLQDLTRYWTAVFQLEAAVGVSSR